MGFFSFKKFQAKKNKASTLSLLMVGTERLELSHLAALEPKSSASANFATSAHARIIDCDCAAAREEFAN